MGANIMYVRGKFLITMSGLIVTFGFLYFYYEKFLEPEWGYVNYESKIAHITTPEAILLALRRVELTKERPMLLNDGIWELQGRLGFGRPLSEDVRRDITVRLVKIYRELDDELTNTANKKRIIEIIGNHDNSAEAHKFYLDVLENGPAHYREHALWAMHHIHGNDLYDEVKSLMKRGIVDSDKYYYAVIAANRERALSEILETIKTTEDPYKFVRMGVYLSDYRDVNLMDAVVDRYPDFLNKNNIGASGTGALGNSVYTLNDAISHAMLLKYLNAKDGDRLRGALEIFRRRSMFSKVNLPLLQNKLSSSDVKVRDAIVDCMNESAISNPEEIAVLAIFQEAEKIEKDKKLKSKLQAYSKALKTKVDRDASERERMGKSSQSSNSGR